MGVTEIESLALLPSALTPSTLRARSVPAGLRRRGRHRQGPDSGCAPSPCVSCACRRIRLRVLPSTVPTCIIPLVGVGGTSGRDLTLTSVWRWEAGPRRISPQLARHIILLLRGARKMLGRGAATFTGEVAVDGVFNAARRKLSLTGGLEGKPTPNGHNPVRPPSETFPPGIGCPGKARAGSGTSSGRRSVMDVVPGYSDRPSRYRARALSGRGGSKSDGGIR